MTASEAYLIHRCVGVRLVLQRVGIEATTQAVAAWTTLYLAGDDKGFQDRLYPDVLLVAQQVCGEVKV